MKLLLFTACIVASTIPYANPASGRVASGGEDWARKRKEVVKLRADLARLGVEAFVTNAALPKTAPHIHSQCWVDWLPGEEVERRAFEQEKRDFGLDLVRRLEIVAVADVRGRDEAYLEQRINFLLKLCDWLSTEHGYGNHYISQWTINIALNSMAVLALDEKVPTTTVRSLMARLPSKKTTLRFRLDVLNSEAPHRFSLPFVLMDCAEGNRRLNIQWCRHMKETDEHYRALYENGRRKYVSYQFESVKEDDPVYAFYWDDSARGKTIGASWNMKRHYGLTVGDFDRNCRPDVESILAYREEMGALTLPTAKECADDGARRAYVEHIDLKWTMRNIYAGSRYVGNVVIRVCSGIPLDLETQQLKQQGVSFRQ